MGKLSNRGLATLLFNLIGDELRDFGALGVCSMAPANNVCFHGVRHYLNLFA